MTWNVPNVTFAFREGDEPPEGGGCPIGGEFVFKTSRDLFAGKRVIIFSLPGAFTPTCSTYQLPGFDEQYEQFKAKGIDEMGNYTLGIKENTIFPESADEELKDVFGLAVTVGTNISNPFETKAFLTYLGFPFKKDEGYPKVKAIKRK